MENLSAADVLYPCQSNVKLTPWQKWTRYQLARAALICFERGKDVGDMTYAGAEAIVADANNPIFEQAWNEYATHLKHYGKTVKANQTPSEIAHTIADIYSPATLRALNVAVVFVDYGTPEN